MQTLVFIVLVFASKNLIMSLQFQHCNEHEKKLQKNHEQFSLRGHHGIAVLTKKDYERKKRCLDEGNKHREVLMYGLRGGKECCTYLGRLGNET